MATLYIDFENGNDNYGGTSFSLLASATDGRITSTTFSSVSANFPNDGSLINQYLSIFNGTIYAVYQITAWINSTSLTIAAIPAGTSLANQAVDRQYYIGGRWKTLTNGATAVRIVAGDDIRVMASPEQTSLGVNGTWTSSALRSTKSISSSTNASPIVITCNNHGFSNGDTVVITGHLTNTNANGTWEISNVATNTFSLVGSTGNGVGTGTGTIRLRNNSVVKLASAVTANIASTGNRGNGRTAWEGLPPNITASLNTTNFKEGDCSDSIAIGADFTTGRAAFKATGTLDLSEYQQVSFWIRQTSGILAVAGDLSLRLCSDTLGITTVHTINIPALSILDTWVPFTIDLGTNLNNSIQSIALYVDTDRGAATFLLSNIIACKASSSSDSLSLVSLIGKNTGTEPWVAIQSINGTRVFLDGLLSHAPTTTTLMGYTGVSETVTAYKRETIKIFNGTGTLNENGTISAPFNLSGGWNRTDMSTQTNQTYVDGSRSSIVGFSFFAGVFGDSFTSASYWNISKISGYRFNRFLWYANGNNLRIFDIENINHNTIGLSFTSNSYSVFSGINNMCFNNNAYAVNGGTSGILIQDTKNINNNSSNALVFSNPNIFYTIINIDNINNNAGNGLNLNSLSNSLINNIQNINDNNQYGISFANSSKTIVSNIGSISGSASTVSNYTYINNIHLSSATDFCQFINVSGITGGANSISCIGASNNRFTNINAITNSSSAISTNYVQNYFYNCTFPAGSLATGFTSYLDGKVFLQNYNNDSNNHQIYMFGGSIVSSTSVRNTESGISWALSPTSLFRSNLDPITLSLGKILVFANKLVTISGYLRRTNTALTIQLKVKGNQIAGVGNDIVAPITVAANTWEQVTLTFTPTETGVIELVGEAYGGTTHTGYIDDLTITQAP